MSEEPESARSSAPEEPDYSRCSLDELYRIKRFIKPDLKPERYQRLMAQIAQREEEIQEELTPEVIHHYQQSFNKRLKLLAAGEFIHGVLTLIALIGLFTNRDPLIDNVRISLLLSGLASVTSVVAGIILWARPEHGRGFSLLIQALRIPEITTAGILYMPGFGSDVQIRFGIGNAMFGINLVAIVLFGLIVSVPSSAFQHAISQSYDHEESL